MLVKTAWETTSGPSAMIAGSTNSPSQGNRKAKKAIPNPHPVNQASLGRLASTVAHRNPPIATGAMNAQPQGG